MIEIYCQVHSRIIFYKTLNEGCIQDLGMLLIILYPESVLSILEDFLLYLFLPLGIISCVEIKQSESKNIFKSASKAYLIDELQGFTCERLLCPVV